MASLASSWDASFSGWLHAKTICGNDEATAQHRSWRTCATSTFARLRSSCGTLLVSYVCAGGAVAGGYVNVFRSVEPFHTVGIIGCQTVKPEAYMYMYCLESV